ncbi:hypothetical protein [Jiangella mangrovi]|uniref:Uncharacterized protein n=1 Tax=Jiangella mangrovi TaxID=1524084 RepID=A0A7W9LPI5_9ACTN|nr:hypothetical protein [Jiangella mangrovi]MBB5791443.1 hypothetical protein [Jiangella mangrovi]
MSDELLRPTVQGLIGTSEKPWRLTSQAYVAFFGGVLASTTIAVVNARRLGVPPDKRRLMMLVGGLAFVAAVVVGALLADDGTGAARLGARVVAVVAILLLIRLQQPMDRAFVLRNGEYGSLWGPGLLAVFTLGLVEVLVIVALAGAL